MLSKIRSKLGEKSDNLDYRKLMFVYLDKVGRYIFTENLDKWGYHKGWFQDIFMVENVLPKNKICKLMKFSWKLLFWDNEDLIFSMLNVKLFLHKKHFGEN